MGRPIYEKEEDLIREKKVMDKVIEKYFFGATAKKLHQHSGADFLVTEPDGKETVVEIKTRTVPVRKYKTYIIAKQKYDKLLKLHQNHDYAFLIIKWEDAIGVIELPLENNFKIVMGGRYDRNDRADFEEMIEFNISDFNIIHRF